MKEFSVEDIWEETDFQTKKKMVMECIDNFQYKKKAPLFRQKVESSRSGAQLDQIALNIHMAGQGLTTIR